MCGIAMIVSRSLSLDEKRARIQVMVSAMHHRGPDAREVFIDHDVAIGSTRLAIVDREYQGTFAYDESQQLIVTMNGEIYNAGDLRRRLSSSHRFVSATDTEVAAHLIEDQEISALSSLSGDFAIAVWNRATREGFIARDRFGVKPLYHARVDGIFVVASELRAILEAFPQFRRLDNDAVCEFLQQRFVAAPRSIYAEVRKLPAGHVLRLGDRDLEAITYAGLPRTSTPTPKAVAELAEEGRDLLRNAVAARLPDEVPFGVLLSGGLDSSLLLAMAHEQRGSGVATYSVTYPDSADSAYSEHLNSRWAADRFRSNHVELPITCSDFVASAPSVVAQLEEPLSDPAAVLLSTVYRRAAEDGNVVLLSGEGADELFAGYRIYEEWVNDAPNYAGAGHLLTREQVLCVVGPALRPYAAEREAVRLHPTPGAGLDVLLRRDCASWLPDYLLLRADKVSMAHSTEARVPYLDWSIAEYAFTLSASMKLRNGVGKWILRRIASDYLPSAVVEQEKRGFPLPLNGWLGRGIHARPVQQALEAVVDSGFISNVALRRLIIDCSCTRSRHDAQTLWTMVVLGLFLLAPSVDRTEC
jgi:asparagine synthase (glutamine-hydrolysing)